MFFEIGVTMAMPKVLKKCLQVSGVVTVLLTLTALITHQSLPTHRTDGLPMSAVATDGIFAPELLAGHENQTGIYPLADGKDAFVARIALIEGAKHTLDVRYYILHDDVTGRLLLQYLYKAAERGVVVRLLLDDNNSKGMDKLLSSINAHPNIHIRLFNPFMQRDKRFLGYLSDFFRLNRRMHNKSLTADGMATIVGGRNIGDEYFDAGEGVMFADLDVLAVGEVVPAVNADFQAYWQSASAYALTDIINTDIAAFDSKPSSDNATQDYLFALQHSQLLTQLKSGALPVFWTKATLVSDDPIKGLGKASFKQTVMHKIAPIMQHTQSELVIVSPYFVPSKQGTRLFSDIATSGKSVTILTNALSATDVAPVHAGYAKYRKELLNAGVQLYELKPNATVHTKDHGGAIKSSGASLHAKSFVVDNKTIFIGSFNMDPRSAKINTEMGLVIDSGELAKLMTDGLKANRDNTAYQVSLNDGDLMWQTQENGTTVSYDSEPNSGLIERLLVMICALLPIEWLL